MQRMKLDMKLSWPTRVLMVAFLIWSVWFFYDNWKRPEFHSEDDSRGRPEFRSEDDSRGGAEFHSEDIAVLKRIKEQNDVNGTLNWEGPDYGAWKDVSWSHVKTGKRVTALNLRGKNLTGSLNVSNLTGLVDLRCEENQLTGLNVTSLSALRILRCNNNRLNELDVSGLTGLKELRCYGNELTGLNLDGAVSLAKVTCNSNRLEELDADNLPSLSELDCRNNSLRVLNLSGAAELKILNCENNRLNELDVSGLSKLEELWCGKNGLTVLNLTGAAKLTMLSCKHNKLTELDLSGIDRLGADFEGNSLTALRIAPESQIRGYFSLKKGASLKLLSPRPLNAEYNGPVTAQSLPDGTLVTAWRAPNSGMLIANYHVSPPDGGRSRFDFKVRSDGTDVHSLAGVVLVFKSIVTSGDDAGIIDMEAAGEFPNGRLSIDDFGLDTRAFVQFGQDGFDSVGTAPIYFDTGPQRIYAVVSSNSGVEQRYRIDVNAARKPD